MSTRYFKFFVFILLLVMFAGSVSADMTLPEKLDGYAWSSNIGWIAFQGPFIGVDVNQDTGDVTGYAWSSNIGFIKFGGLSGFPTGSGTQSINAKFDGDNLVGWARAVRPMNPEGQTLGGWDGWISLSGTGYGVKLEDLNEVSGDIRDVNGFAWGSDVVGWVTFGEGGNNAVTEGPSPSCIPAGGVCGGGGSFNCTIDLESFAPIVKNNSGSMETTRDAIVSCGDVGNTGDVVVSVVTPDSISVSPESESCSLDNEDRKCKVILSIDISSELTSNTSIPVTASYAGQNVTKNISVSVPSEALQCAVTPATARLGRTVTWKVLNPEDGYTYEWTGAVSGAGESVSGQFNEEGNKTATVTASLNGEEVYSCSATVKVIKGPIIEEF